MYDEFYSCVKEVTAFCLGSICGIFKDKFTYLSIEITEIY